MSQLTYNALLLKLRQLYINVCIQSSVQGLSGPPGPPGPHGDPGVAVSYHIFYHYNIYMHRHTVTITIFSAHRAKKDLVVIMESQEKLVPLVLLVSRESLEHPEPRAIKAYQDHLESLDIQEGLDLP